MVKTQRLLVLCACLAAAWAAADETNAPAAVVPADTTNAPAGWSSGPSNTVSATVITSRRLNFDYKRMIARFERFVLVRDPRFQMQSDKLTVLFTATNPVKSVTALGRVHMIQADEDATCNKAVYIAGSGDVILSGNATVKREKDVVSGDMIEFNLYDEQMTCTPAHLTIHPGQGPGAALPGLP